MKFGSGDFIEVAGPGGRGGESTGGMRPSLDQKRGGRRENGEKEGKRWKRREKGEKKGNWGKRRGKGGKREKWVKDRKWGEKKGERGKENEEKELNNSRSTSKVNLANNIVFRFAIFTRDVFLKLIQFLRLSGKNI